MALSHDPDTTNRDPYYDDFDASKGYYRALFKPGTAVQARELTQIQTTLQNQIESMGTHIFENGAVIAGGGIAESNTAALRVDTSNPIETSSINSVVGETISNGTVNAKVLKYIAGSTLTQDSNQVLIYQYTSNGVFAAEDVLSTASGVTFSITPAGACADAIVPNASLVSVDQGVFYVDGFFVYNAAQNESPFSIAGVTAEDGDFRYRDFSNPTASVGFNIDKSTIDSEVDPTLKDPSSGFYNYNAPGADRYKVELTLSSIPFSGALGDSSGLTFDTSNYFELLRMVDGVSTKTVKYTQYSEIEETLARRTFDESGSYTVNSPKIRVTDYNSVFTPADDTKFAVGIEPNKSYVRGFEVDTQSTFFLGMNKTRSTAVVPGTSEILSSPFQHHVVVDRDESRFGMGDQEAYSPASNIEDMKLYDVWHGDDKSYGFKGSGGASFGTCRIRQYSCTNSQLILASVFDIQLNGSTAFNQAGYLVAQGAAGVNATTGDFIRIDNSFGGVGPQGAKNKPAIFPVKNRAVAGGLGGVGGQETSFVVQEKSLLNLPAGANEASIRMTDGRQVSNQDSSQFLVLFGTTAGSTAAFLRENNNEYTIDLIDPDTSGTEIRVKGLPTAPSGGITFALLHNVVYNSTTFASNIHRTLADIQTNETTVESGTQVYRDGILCAEFELAKSNVYTVNSISDNPSAGGGLGTVTLPEFDHLDDGQRSTAYFRSKVYVPVDQLTNVGGLFKISINYNYYEHSGLGPVTINSYLDLNLAYESIPVFTDPDTGIRYRTADCIDFRPVQNATSMVGFGLPFNRQVPSRVGYVHYLPRIDVISLCADSNYRVVQGVASLDPKPPTTTSEDMDLYQVKMAPYIFDLDKDVTVKFIENKRYTMRDIGEIENKVENVERDRYLEVLQSDAIARGAAESTNVIQDSVLIDDFSSQTFADVPNRDHNASINYRDRGVKPAFEASGADLVVNTIGTGLTMSDDRVVTYNYSSQTSLVGATGTGTLAVNPFGVTDFLGFLEIEPKTDFFYNTDENPNVLVNEFGENNQYYITGRSYGGGKNDGFGLQDEEYIYHWFGSANNDATEDSSDPLARDYKSPVKNSRSKLPDRILRTVSDKTVDESVVPFMRSVGITFSATGMLPGSTVFAFFDREPVGDLAGYSVDSKGNVAANHLTVPSSLLTGIKTFKLTDSATDSIGSANTSADTKFFAQGLQNTQSGSIVSDLPTESRRQSVNSSSIINSSFLDIQSRNFADIQNGLDPLTQEIVVEAGTFPQGTFLESIDLYFNSKDDDLPVTLQIRPMVNGSPHEFSVVPHSTVTATPVTNGGPNRSSNTRFKFSSPVHLPVGNWAVCLYSNSDKNVLFKSTIGQPYLLSSGTPNPESTTVDDLSAGAAGIRMGSLFLPLNNGTRVKNTNESLMMNVNRCRFIGASSNDDSNRNLLLDCDFAGVTTDANSLVIASNEQLFTSNRAFTRYDVITDTSNNPHTYVGVSPNKSLQLIDKMRNQIVTGSVRTNVAFSRTDSTDISPVVNLDRTGMVFVDRKTDDRAIEGADRNQNQAGRGTKTCYVSKKISFDNSPATDLRVFLDIAPNDGQVAVHIKATEGDGDFDRLVYSEMIWDEDALDNPAVSGSNELVTYTFKPQTDPNRGGFPGSFTSYAVKITVICPDDTPESGLPVIKNLRAIAIR